MNLALLLLALGGPAAAQQPAPDEVKVSLEQYLDLYEKARIRPPTPRAAAVPATLSSARFMGQVELRDGEPTAAVFTARMRVDNLTEGWVEVRLLPATVAIQSARIGNNDASLTIKDGYYVLLTNQKGATDIVVRFAVAVNTSQGSSGFAFELAGIGATELELAVPAADALDFKVANARLQRDRTVGSMRIVEATVPGTGSLAVTWQRRVSEAQALEPRIYAEVHTLAGVGEGVLHAAATIQHTILFAGVDTLRLAVPPGMTVLDVQGPGLRDWTVSDDHTLTAWLNYEAEGSYRLSVELERVIAGQGAVEVPLIRPLGVERSKGFVGVQALGNLELTGGGVQGAAPVDVRTLPASILGITSQPVLLGYKYLGDGATIPLRVAEHEEVEVLVTLLDQADATTMFTADGRRLTSVRYQVRNNRRQYLRLRLPEQAELWSAAVAGRAVQPARGEEGELLVPLVRSQSSGSSLASFEVEVVYVEGGRSPDGRGRGRFEAELPRADAPATWVGWTVYAPVAAKVRERHAGGSLRSVDFLSRPSTSSEVMQVQQEIQSNRYVAAEQAAGGALGSGAAPVRVHLPVDGQPLYFEKLLALDERLWVSFPYKGLD